MKELTLFSSSHTASNWETVIQGQVCVFPLHLSSLNVQGGDAGRVTEPISPCPLRSPHAPPCLAKVVPCSFLRGPLWDHYAPVRGALYQIPLATSLPSPVFFSTDQVSRSLVLKAWCAYQQHQHYLYEKCSLSGPTPRPAKPALQ